MSPIALGFGADPGFRAPMAIVVIGGLITSTFLSLLVIPVLYEVVDELVERFKRKLGFGGGATQRGAVMDDTIQFNWTVGSRVLITTLANMQSG